jgi:putative IMPACT (imprinted ancient) family translation regulator
MQEVFGLDIRQIATMSTADLAELSRQAIEAENVTRNCIEASEYYQRIRDAKTGLEQFYSEQVQAAAKSFKQMDRATLAANRAEVDYQGHTQLMQAESARGNQLIQAQYQQQISAVNEQFNAALSAIGQVRKTQVQVSQPQMQSKPNFFQRLLGGAK